MKLALTLILLTLSLKASNYNEWHNKFINLSTVEKAELTKTFNKAQPFNLGYSMASIHFKESMGGRYQFNINNATSIDVGSFMINTKDYLRRTDRKVNKWNTARAMEELKDYEVNFHQALVNFQGCMKQSKGNYVKAFQYYNGWLSGSTRSKQYAKDLQIIIQILQRNL